MSTSPDSNPCRNIFKSTVGFTAVIAEAIMLVNAQNAAPARASEARAIIGVGMRGKGDANHLDKIQGVDFMAIYDLNRRGVNASAKKLRRKATNQTSILVRRTRGRKSCGRPSPAWCSSPLLGRSVVEGSLGSEGCAAEEIPFVGESWHTFFPQLSVVGRCMAIQFAALPEMDRQSSKFAPPVME